MDDQQLETAAMASHFFSYLKQVVALATAAERMVTVRPEYTEFIQQSKILCGDFADLCRAGDIDAMTERFRQTLLCAIAAQQDQKKAVN